LKGLAGFQGFLTEASEGSEEAQRKKGFNHKDHRELREGTDSTANELELTRMGEHRNGRIIREQDYGDGARETCQTPAFAKALRPGRRERGILTTDVTDVTDGKPELNRR
jgi:hypothetical protein